MSSMTAFTAVDTPRVRMIEVSGVIFLMGAMVNRSRRTATPTTRGMTTRMATSRGNPAPTALIAANPARAAYSPWTRLTISRTAKMATKPSATSP
ncbi:MAG: hypothetical protein IPH27_07950 [Actinomycetales bacterium]|nr:hypothetical protein [Candidatus Phosphoribacter baldrii]